MFYIHCILWLLMFYRLASPRKPDWETAVSSFVAFEFHPLTLLLLLAANCQNPFIQSSFSSFPLLSSFPSSSSSSSCNYHHHQTLATCQNHFIQSLFSPTSLRCHGSRLFNESKGTSAIFTSSSLKHIPLYEISLVIA